MVNLTKLKSPRFLLSILLVLIIAGGGYTYLQLQKAKLVPPEEVTEVGIEYPRGTVEKIETGKIAIRTDAGLRTLLVDENTVATFEPESLAEALSGEKAASLADIKVGDEIAASVKTFSDGTEKAFFITILRQQKTSE